MQRPLASKLSKFACCFLAEQLVAAFGPVYAAEPMPPVTTYWHNYTDAGGVSHMIAVKCTTSNWKACPSLPVRSGKIDNHSLVPP
jgi:hypothetical protein